MDTVKIGEYNGIPVYYNETGKDFVMTGRGPVNKELETGQIVFWNHKTNKMTLENGDPYIPIKSEYKDFCYIVGTMDIDEAIEHIKKRNELYK
jgi:hypothetical protein